MRPRRLPGPCGSPRQVARVERGCGVLAQPFRHQSFLVRRVGDGELLDSPRDRALLISSHGAAEIVQLGANAIDVPTVKFFVLVRHAGLMETSPTGFKVRRHSAVVLQPDSPVALQH